jgi:hypothetical protein
MGAFEDLARLPFPCTCWRAELDGKLRKKPRHARRDDWGSSTDCTRWGTWAQAAATAHRFKLGLGLILTDIGSDPVLCAIDLDHCIDDAGEIAPRAAAIINRFPGCYVERSPSGKGLHILFLIRRAEAPVMDRRWACGVEIYIRSAGRFITVTGRDASGSVKLVPRVVVDALVRQLVDCEPKPTKPAVVTTGAPPQRGETDHDATLRILEHMPNCGRFASQHDWSLVCGAVYHATAGSAAGLAALTAWTARGGYDDAAKTCAAQWRHFQRCKPRFLDIRWLINRSREAGFEPYPRGSADGR